MLWIALVDEKCGWTYDLQSILFPVDRRLNDDGMIAFSQHTLAHYRLVLQPEQKLCIV